jgi:cellulose synthase/poly-beta-1,6-N-acetylglucosamine synthase-like glycosyltransferase
MAETVFTTIFWASLGLIAYTYAGYPLIVLAVGAFFPRNPRDPSYEPTVSVLIAAYNEEGSIAKKVHLTLALDYPENKLDVIVVSDGSTDRTNEILAGLQGPRVRFFARPRGGKTNAQNFGVTQCRGDIVVFSDATSIYKQDSIRQLVAYFADPKVGAVGGLCRFFGASEGNSPTGPGQILYGGYEQAIRLFQSRILTATACAGAIYATRRKLYVPLPGNACSDMAEPIEIVRSGYRVVYAPEAQAYESSTRSPRDEFRMRVRVTTQGIHGLFDAGSMLGLPHGLWLSFQLFCHKGLRYFLPVPLILALFSSAALAPASTLIRAFFALQTSFYIVALTAFLVPLERLPKLFSLPLYFCTGNAAILASVFEALRGNRFTVWDTARK